MKPRASKLVGTLFITLAVFNLMFRVLGGPELSLLPWPISVIVIAIGVLLLRMGRTLEKGSGGSREETRRGDSPELGSASWSGPPGPTGRISSLPFSDEDSEWRERRFIPDTPLRMVVVLAAVAAFLCAGMAVLEWGFHSRHWSPPIVAMTCLTVSSLSLASYSLLFARKRRRNRRTHV